MFLSVWRGCRDLALGRVSLGDLLGVSLGGHCLLLLAEQRLRDLLRKSSCSWFHPETRRSRDILSRVGYSIRQEGDGWWGRSLFGNG